MKRTSGTLAIVALQRAGVEHAVHPYELDGATDADTYGEAVAATLGVDPDRLFKTLVAEVDGGACVAIVPVSQRLSPRALARAAGGKRADLADRAIAERLTGYVTGGISPFGQKRRLPVFVDEAAARFRTVFVSGGRRGLQVEVAPEALVSLLGATVADLTG